MRTAPIKRTVQIALLIAAEIVLSRFLSIATPIAKIGFAFVPIVLAAVLFGPVYGGLTAAVGDFLGAILFPIGAYFPGFTLTAFLTGFAYGLFLYGRPKNLVRIAACVLCVQLVLHLGLNTVWLWMITGAGHVGLLPTRVIQTAVMVPIQILGVSLACGQLHQHLKFRKGPA